MWAARAALGLVLVAPLAHAGKVSADYARQVDAVQMRLAQIEGLYAELETSMRRLEEGQRALAVVPSAGGQAMDGDAVRALRGQLEVVEFEVRSLREELDALAQDLDTRALWQEARVAQVERALGLAPPPVPTGDTVAPPPEDGGDDTMEDSGDPVAPTTAVIGAPQDADGLMDLAEEHMRAGRQRAARAVLDRVIEEFPDSERLPEALYRRAETYFNDEQWGTAANEFQKVVDRYPRDELAAWSILRQGEAFERMGQRDTATLFWEDLLARYPRSDAADEARSLLRR